MASAPDDLDLRIIDALRTNGCISNLELAEIVPLSHSAISRRIKVLQDTGVIRGYTVRIDPAVVGETVRGFVSVCRRQEVTARSLAEQLAKLDGVTSSWIVSGEYDIMLELATRDMAHFSTIMLDQIQCLPGVASTKSIFVLATLKER